VTHSGTSNWWQVLLALLILGAVAWLPGLAFYRRLLPGHSKLGAFAVAPAISAGLLYGLGEVATSLGVAVDARLALGLATLALVALTPDLRRGLPARFDWLPATAVATAAVLGTLVWSLGMRHLSAVPPHNDGYNHGYFVQRIALTHSLDPAVVVRHDVLLGGHGADFYPFALHQQAAVLVQLLHLDVAVAWTLTSLSLVVVALPLGLLALGRTLFPCDRYTPAACALLGAAVPALTYSTAWWGGYALAAGFAVAPGAIELTWWASIRGGLRATLVAGVALAGVAGVHTSEFSLVPAIVAVAVVTTFVTQRAPGKLLTGSYRLLLIVAISLAVLAPAVRQMLRGLDERTTYPIPDGGVPFSHAIREVLAQISFVPPITPTAIVLGFWVGFAVCIVTGRAVSWIVTWVVFAACYVWLAAYPSGTIAAITATWYSDPFRLAYILAFLSIPFLAVAITSGRQAHRREIRLCGPVLGIVLIVTSIVPSVRAIRSDYQDFSLVGPDERAAFRYLADHVGSREHVLNQHQDGSPWMYSLYGVVPVVALKTDFANPIWRNANYLARHVQAFRTDPEARRLLALFDVHYVYVGPTVFRTERPDLDGAALAVSTSFRLVFEKGGARVYEVLR
jgi:hypothetical protein